MNSPLPQKVSLYFLCCGCCGCPGFAPLQVSLWLLLHIPDTLENYYWSQPRRGESFTQSCLSILGYHIFDATSQHWVVNNNGMVWYGMVWYGMVWYGMVWYGMVWYGMVWYGMVWYGMVWYGMVWHGMVWYGMVWYGMVWYGMLWYGLIESRSAVA